MDKEKNIAKGNISYKSFQKMLKMQVKELKFECINCLKYCRKIKFLNK